MEFFNTLKEFMLNEEVKTLKKLIPYYETLYQKRDDLSALNEDCEKYQCDIRYEKDITGGYTDGKLIIYLFEKGNENYGYSIGYHYEIELLRDERFWGYCECEGECSEQDCCAWAGGSFSNVELDAVITNVEIGEEITEVDEEWGGRDSYVKVTLYHNQNPIAQADLHADAGNGGYYYSVGSFVVKGIHYQIVSA